MSADPVWPESGWVAANPFSASRFAPGALPWFASEPGSELETLFARAARPGARQQILGAHGSGKSTLLHHLEVEARRRGCAVVRFRGSEPPSLTTLARLVWPPRPGLVLVDEVAELGAWHRQLLRLARRNVALVVTTHEDLGVPTLARCEMNARLAQRVVAQLLGRPSPVSASDLERRLARHAGNLREVLFELYDEVETSSSG